MRNSLLVRLDPKNFPFPVIAEKEFEKRMHTASKCKRLYWVLNWVIAWLNSENPWTRSATWLHELGETENEQDPGRARHLADVATPGNCLNPFPKHVAFPQRGYCA